MRISMKLNRATIIILFVLVLPTCRSGSRDELTESSETGIASWYGHPYHGRKTANGEIYDMEQLTAAHRVLAFGSIVRVTNMGNKKTVDVRINDRGPFVKGRIIDLSHAAAEALNIDGIAEVSIKVLSTPKTRAVLNFAVQVGVFEDQAQADRIRETMAAKYGSAKIVLRDGDPQTWRVIVGSEPTVTVAEALGEKVRAENGTDYFVVALDNE